MSVRKVFGMWKGLGVEHWGGKVSQIGGGAGSLFGRNAFLILVDYRIEDACLSCSIFWRVPLAIKNDLMNVTLQDSCSSIWLMFEVLAVPDRYLALYLIISHNLICFCFEVCYLSVRNGLCISLSERSDKCLGLCVVCGSEGFRHWRASCAGQELWDVELRRKPVSFSLGPEHEVEIFL